MSRLDFTFFHALWEYQKSKTFHIRAISQLSAPGVCWCVSFYYYYQNIRLGCVPSSALRRKVTAQAWHHILTTPTFQEVKARELLQVEAAMLGRPIKFLELQRKTLSQKKGEEGRRRQTRKRAGNTEGRTQRGKEGRKISSTAHSVMKLDQSKSSL